MNEDKLRDVLSNIAFALVSLPLILQQAAPIQGITPPWFLVHLSWYAMILGATIKFCPGAFAALILWIVNRNKPEPPKSP